LKRLEYRGYDSSGVAIQDANKMDYYRAVGKIAELEKKINGLEINGTTGIAHTRWATHGEPTEKNAHPHSDMEEKIFVIHNGIIENYQSIKKRLEKKGVIFRSDTDTEVLAHLISENFSGSLNEAVRKSISQVEGTFGLAVLHKDIPGQIVVARRGSPLIIGLGDDGNFAASDVSAMVRYTKNVIHLNDNELATITKDDVSISTAQATAIQREAKQWSGQQMM
jgi:glucosamine--fructose-6-phosphate aminotransferase (isomerizing)